MYIQINHQGRGTLLPKPEEEKIRHRCALLRKLMMNESVYQAAPINEAIDSPGASHPGRRLPCLQGRLIWTLLLAAQ